MKKAILISCCLLLSCRLFASHIATAELRYEYTGTANDYKVILTLLKACEPNNSMLNTTEAVLINSSCGSSVLMMPMISDDTIQPYCVAGIGSCSMPGSVWPGFEKRVYEATVSLAPCSDWLFSWSLCCRNAGIVNLSNPGAYETYVEAFLDNSAAVNTSAWIPNPSPFVVSVSNNTIIPINTVDAENDSVDYEWYQPLEAAGTGGAPIPYTAGGYSFANPLGTGGTASINAATQEMTLNAPLAGKYALAMKMSEYRNGVLVGYTMRDFTALALNTTAPLTAPAPAPGSSLHYVTCPGQSNSITVTFNDPTSTDYVDLNITAPAIPGWTFTVATIPGTGSATAIITWTTPSTMNPATLPHFYFNIYAFDNSCPAAAYAYYAIVVQDIQCNTDSVWAGDANGDYTVNVYDPLAIAVAYGTTDVPRPAATTTWQAGYCPDWAQSFVNTVNMKHADCNGDGTVDNADLGAVSANYGQVHLKNGGVKEKTTTDPDLYFDVTGISFTPGAQVSVPIKLGTAAVMMNNLYGLAAHISLDGFNLDAPATISYPQSWLGNASNTLDFTRQFGTNDLDWAYARTNHQQVSGQGAIAALNFTVPASVTAQSFTLAFDNVALIDANGSPIEDYNAIPATSNITYPNGISQVISAEAAYLIPNPSSAKATLVFNAVSDTRLEIAVTDITGRKVWSEAVKLQAGENNIALPASTLTPGIYNVLLKNTAIGSVRIIKWIRQ